MLATREREVVQKTTDRRHHELVSECGFFFSLRVGDGTWPGSPATCRREARSAAVLAAPGSPSRGTGRGRSAWRAGSRSRRRLAWSECTRLVRDRPSPTTEAPQRPRTDVCRRVPGHRRAVRGAAPRRGGAPPRAPDPPRTDTAARCAFPGRRLRFPSTTVDASFHEASLDHTCSRSVIRPGSVAVCRRSSAPSTIAPGPRDRGASRRCAPAGSRRMRHAAGRRRA